MKPPRASSFDVAPEPSVLEAQAASAAREPHGPGTWLAVLTRAQVTGLVLLFCVSVLAWSLFWRLPLALKPLPVFAQEADLAASRFPAVSEADLLRQRLTADALGAELVSGREEFKTLLAQLETQAQRLGWRIEVTVEPPRTTAHGFKELTIYPVIAQLAAPDQHGASSAATLVEWLNAISSLPRAVEVSSLGINADGLGRMTVRVGVHFFSRTVHESASPK